MQLDLLGSSKPRGADWDTSDDNLIFIFGPATEGLRTEVDDRAKFLRASLGLGKMRDKGVQHVTVSHFGHYGHIPDAVEAAREIGRAVAIKRSTIVLDQYRSYFHPEKNNPFALVASETPDAVKLANKELVKRVRRLGIECPSGINAHVTLRYGAELVPLADMQPII
ncbi:hypothetical protein BH10PSE1_BH10PSE1_03270 [soil metagenome]